MQCIRLAGWRSHVFPCVDPRQHGTVCCHVQGVENKGPRFRDKFANRPLLPPLKRQYVCQLQGWFAVCQWFLEIWFCCVIWTHLPCPPNTGQGFFGAKRQNVTHTHTHTQFPSHSHSHTHRGSLRHTEEAACWHASSPMPPPTTSCLNPEHPTPQYHQPHSSTPSSSSSSSSASS